MDKKFLALIQENFPLTLDPYRKIGDKLGLSPKEVLQKLEDLKLRGILRRVGGILNPAMLGYSTVLMAAKILPGEVEKAANYIASFPQVTHDYLRAGELNLWFTLIYREEKELSRILSRIRKNISPKSMFRFTAIKFFKLKAVFGLASRVEALPQAPAKPGKIKNEKALLALAAKDLPLSPRPFASWAKQLAISEPELLSQLESLLSAKKIRRFGGILNHQKAGFSHNAMLVFDLPVRKAEKAGALLAKPDYISHCYLRRRNKNWPYNLYAMLHAESEELLDSRIKEAVLTAKAGNFKVLKTLKEYKKISWQPDFKGDKK